MSRFFFCCMLALALLGRCPAAGADAWVYRCDGSEEVVVFSDRPCSGPEQDPYSQSAAPQVGTRRLELDLRSTGERASRTAPRAGGSPTVVAEVRRCEARRQRLEQVNARLRRGYTPAEGERLRARRRELEDALRAHCRR